MSLIRCHIDLSLVTINISQKNTTDVYLTFKLLFKQLPPGIAGTLNNNVFDYDTFLQHSNEQKSMEGKMQSSNFTKYKLKHYQNNQSTHMDIS